MPEKKADDMQENQEVPIWIKSAVWALGVGLACVGGISSILYSQLITHYDGEITLARIERDAVRSVLADIIPKISSLEQHKLEHDKLADREIARITRIEQAVNDLRSTTGDKRPDPFTGTEGRELERRMDARLDVVERDCITLKYLKQEIEELKKDGKK